MSRSSAARTQHHDDRALRRERTHRAPHARRMSGPANPAYAQVQARTQMHAHAPAYAPRLPARPPLRLAAGGARVALRVAESALEASASRTMDRLVRSRAWVVIIGVGLIGIVAMQVSMLKLNSGIGRAVDTVATLERGNASLKATVSELSSGDRIQRLAGVRGYVMPEPADVTYLRAGDKRADSLRAVRRMGGADPAITGPAGAVSAVNLPETLSATPGATATPTPTSAAPAARTAATTAPATGTPPAAPAPTAAPGPAATPPAPAASTAPGPPATGTGAAAIPPAPQATASGGVTTP